MEKHSEQPSGSRHATEWSDIPPSPEAVYTAKGHIKPSFLERYGVFKKGDKVMDVKQGVEILKHVGQCSQCKESLRKTKGDLPEGSLPF